MKAHWNKVVGQGLEKERNDWFATTRIVLELADVVPVFALGPDGHLVEASQCEQSRWKTLSHDRESDPGRDLIGVVGT